MTDSLLSQRSETKSNRLDPPHELMLANGVDDPTTPWLAMAGRDPNAAPDQLDRQTSELLAYVQQQNDEIDARQAELNAKLAQLDNELRTARLRSGVDASASLFQENEIQSSAIASNMDAGLALDEMPLQSPDEPQSPSAPQPVTDPPVDPEKNVVKEFQEFEEVERLVAQFSSVSKAVEPEPQSEPIAIVAEEQEEEAMTASTDQTPDETTEVLIAEIASDSAASNEEGEESVAETETTETVEIVVAEEVTPTRAEERLAAEQEKIEKQTRLRVDQPVARVETTTAPIAELDPVPVPAKEPIQSLSEPKPHHEAEAATSKSIDSFPQKLSNSHLSRIETGDIQAMADSLDASEIESERRLLAERKIELDRRKTVLQRMQDETQALHRETLEMRLVTEQLWIEISGKAPADHVNELLASLRARLDEHYNEQQGTIDSRRAELVELKELVEHKQEEIRDQSNQLQQWVETRHDEIKSYAAEVDAREMLLDRREHRMREEFSKWEATRGAYQEQLQGLLKKLDISSLAGM